MLRLSTAPAAAAGFTLAADELDGQVVLVTGATGAIGRASALACARAGATVVLLGRHVRALEGVYDAIKAEDLAEPALYPLNLEGASPDDYVALADTLERECGRLDAIVHTAAHFAGLTATEHAAPEQWLVSMHVNVNAPWALTRACLPLLRRSERASVLFLLDDPARVGRALWGGYGASKHALAGVLASLADEYDATPVRFFGLLPAPIRSRLRQLAFVAEHPAGLATPDQAGAAAAWLIADAAALPSGSTLDLRGLPA